MYVPTRFKIDRPSYSTRGTRINRDLFSSHEVTAIRLGSVSLFSLYFSISFHSFFNFQSSNEIWGGCTWGMCQLWRHIMISFHYNYPVRRRELRITVIKAYYYYGFASSILAKICAALCCHKVTSFVRAKPLAKSWQNGKQKRNTRKTKNKKRYISTLVIG